MRIVRICIDANSENRVCYLGAFAATSTVQCTVHVDTHTYSGLGTQYETLRNELEIEINDTHANCKVLSLFHVQNRSAF